MYVTKSSELTRHQDLKSWDLGSKVPISTAEISYYLSCPSPFMGWTSLFQAVCIFQIANLPWLRPKVRRLKVHVLNWCLLSSLAWYDTGPKVSGPEVLRFKVRASKLMFQFLCFYGLVLEWYSTKLSGPVVPRLKVLGPKYEIFTMFHIFKTSVVPHPPCNKHLCVKAVSIVSLWYVAIDQRLDIHFHFWKFSWKLATFSLPRLRK